VNFLKEEITIFNPDALLCCNDLIFDFINGMYKDFESQSFKNEFDAKKRNKPYLAQVYCRNRPFFYQPLTINLFYFCRKKS
jgi:hypothetical protein